MRGEKGKLPPPLNVFLSHAKLDGREISEKIRDSVRSFGQLEAWYDVNDLPYGNKWELPMKEAAEADTAAMIATVTDAYSSRPWCRKEASLARTPSLLTKHRMTRVWKIQPVVTVHQPGEMWARGVPMLLGVPRIGWNKNAPDDTTERIVDRLVLEVLLGLVHRKVALNLERLGGNESCYITWVPDSWTLSSLHHQSENPSEILRIVYPGYGLTMAEIDELKPAIQSFSKSTQLISFEDELERFDEEVR